MVRGRDLFLESHRNNPDVLVRIKEIYLNIFDQMMPSVESFGDVNNGCDDVKVDPTNVLCERVLLSPRLCQSGASYALTTLE